MATLGSDDGCRDIPTARERKKVRNEERKKKSRNNPTGFLGHQF